MNQIVTDKIMQDGYFGIYTDVAQYIDIKRTLNNRVKVPVLNNCFDFEQVFQKSVLNRVIRDTIWSQMDCCGLRVNLFSNKLIR